MFSRVIAPIGPFLSSFSPAGPSAPCLFINRKSILKEVKNTSLDFTAVLLPCSLFINPAYSLGSSFLCTYSCHVLFKVNGQVREDLTWLLLAQSSPSC